jgi:nucleoside diphosphate kinase
MIENTIFIIKPDAILKRKEILKDISARFKIIKLVDFTFNKELIDLLYPDDIGKSHYNALLEYMEEDYSILGHISGVSSGVLSVNSIKAFYDFVGTKSDPALCEPNSLRRIYGQGLSETKSGFSIIKNGIHRVKSEEEYDYELNLFMRKNML